MVANNLFATALAAASFLSTFTVAAPVSGFSTRILNSRQSDLKFPFYTEKVRGVNLGGWFVLEPWITPSVFANQPANVVDEYTLTQQLGKDAATSLLSDHWNTWITQVSQPGSH
jgi:glucan 1,3-beta-glucosidase